ncbi:hypothetical protein K501DRAFT_167145 [Backusella circina FSU 941]|nr:hypothetical protein K501DRAFT_167145 [Backusella circina FSU 941]
MSFIISNTFNVEQTYSLSEISKTLVPSRIEGVQVFALIRVYASEWEDCLVEVNEVCALAWVKKHNNTLPYPISPEVIEAAHGIRQRLLFNETKLCHRSGSYMSTATATSERPTKKTGSTAKLHITCLVSEPNFFVLEMTGEHTSHVPGDRE